MEVKSLIFARYARSPKQEDICLRHPAASQSRERERTLQRAVTA